MLRLETSVIEEPCIGGAELCSSMNRRAIQNNTPVSTHQVVLAAALALTFIAYCGSIAYEFVYDDKPQILNNPAVHSWRFAPHYFTQPAWREAAPGVSSSYYRPTFLLWLRINHMLFGLRAWGWHLTTVLAHLCATLFVYFLAARLVRDRLTAAIVAMIFGLHPVHVEAVAWVSGVPEPLQALLFLAAFVCYLKFRDPREGESAWIGASLTFYFASMLAKETAVVLPVLIFAYEWIFWRVDEKVPWYRRVRRRTLRALRSASGFLALTVVYLVARTLALKGLVHPANPLPLSTVILTWPSILFFYLRILVWPVGLSPFYDLPLVTRPDFVRFVMPVAGLTAVAFVVWTWARKPGNRLPHSLSESKCKVVAFASAWLLVPIMPLLGLALIPGDALAHDRYMYLPSVGFAIIATLALRSLELGVATRYGKPATRGALTAAIALVFLSKTVLQSVVWADDLTLYSRVLAEAPSSNNTKTDLANVLAERGLHAEAIRLYREVLSNDPNHPGANYNLGYLCYRLNRLDEAERFLRQAGAVQAGNPAAVLLLGLTELRRGRLDEAAAALHQAERMNPDMKGIHFARGMVLKFQGDPAGALAEFRQEVALNPDEKAAQEQILEIQRRLLPTQSPFHVVKP